MYFVSQSIAQAGHVQDFVSVSLVSMVFETPRKHPGVRSDARALCTKGVLFMDDQCGKPSLLIASLHSDKLTNKLAPLSRHPY